MGKRGAVRYLQAVARAFLLRQKLDWDLLRARLDAYSKWTPVTAFHAYCRFAQQTTMARGIRGVKCNTVLEN